MVAGCEPCSFSVVDQSGTGCLPIVSSPYQDSTGKDCECSAGCSAGVCLNCDKCSEQTCQVIEGSVQCKCSPGVLYNEEKCFCPLGQYLASNQCEGCKDDCAECSGEGLCTKCKAKNAVVTSKGCVCKENYFNSTSLNTTGSCLICEEKCKACDSSGKCFKCKDQFADLNNGCKCLSGYFLASSGTCQKCNAECSECSSLNQCIGCVALNAVPSGSGCKCEDGFWSSNDLRAFNSCSRCSSMCLTCQAPESCLSCLDSNAEAPSCSCKPGFFLNNSTCTPCPSDCKQCNLDTCTECWDQYAQVDGNTCFCPIGTFELLSDNTFTQCSACRDDCRTCKDGLSCEECRVKGAIKRVVGCACEDGFYSDSIECKVCENWDPERRICLFCNENEFFQKGKCELCSPLCEKCDEVRCSKCVDNAEIVDETCVCTEYYEGTKECRFVEFNVKVEVETYNSMKFFFSVPLNSSLELPDFYLKSSFSGYKLGITEINRREYLIVLKKADYTQYGEAEIQFEDSVISIFSQTLKEKSFGVYFPESSKLKTEQELEFIYKSGTRNSFYAAFTITIFLAIMNFDFVPIWSFLNSVQILIYTQLFNINLTIRLKIILKALQESTKVFNVFEYFVDTRYYVHLKGKWLDFGFETSSLLLNAGHLVSVFLMIVVQMAVVYMFKRLQGFWPFSCEKVKRIVESLWQKFHFNAYLRFVIQTYLDFGVCSILSLLSIGDLNLPNLLNLLLCLGVLACVGLVPFFTVYFTNKQKELIRSKNREFLQRFGSLFYEFSSDQGLMQSYFYFFFFCKRLFFIVSLFSLQEYPQTQLIVNIVVKLSVSLI